MKLLIDCSRLSVGGGVQVGLSVIHNALKDPSLKVCLVCSSQISEQLTDEHMAAAQCHVVGVDLAREKLRQSAQIGSIEKAFSPDVVFNVFGPAYWRSHAVNVQGFALGKMLYPDSRHSYPSRWTRWREEFSDTLKKRLLRRNADYLVVETEVVKERLAPLLPVVKDRIYVVGNSYSPAFEKRCYELGPRLSKAGEHFNVFVPASFYQHKNLEIVPAVASTLKQMGRTDVRFTFTLDAATIGWSRIQALGASHGVAEMLHTVGSVPNQFMADHYLAAHAVLCPTLVESSTAVFPEAFMARRPLLVSDRDFATQLCGSAALYFDPHAPQQIASLIVQLMNDQTLHARLVQAGESALGKNYPSPADKWAMQLKMLRDVVQRGKPKTRL